MQGDPLFIRINKHIIICYIIVGLHIVSSECFQMIFLVTEFDGSVHYSPLPI